MDNTARKLEPEVGGEVVELIKRIITAGVFTHEDQEQLNGYASASAGRAASAAVAHLTELITAGKIAVR